MSARQPFYVDEQLALYQGDALAVLRTPDGHRTA